MQIVRGGKLSKVFPANNKRSCNRETFPPRTICIIRYAYELCFFLHTCMASRLIILSFNKGSYLSSDVHAGGLLIDNMTVQMGHGEKILAKLS